MEEEGERGGVAEREEAGEEDGARSGDAGHEREEEQAERHVGRAGQRQPPLQLPGAYEVGARRCGGRSSLKCSIHGAPPQVDAGKALVNAGNPGCLGGGRCWPIRRDPMSFASAARAAFALISVVTMINVGAGGEFRAGWRSGGGIPPQVQGTQEATVATVAAGPDRGRWRWPTGVVA